MICCSATLTVPRLITVFAKILLLICIPCHQEQFACRHSDERLLIRFKETPKVIPL